MEANRKRVQVHMLPTNGKDIAMLSKRVKDGMLQSANGPEGVANCNTMWQPQHLYFTNDEEIKEGDWYLLGNTPRQSTGDLGKPDTKWLKIIASTDPKLTTCKDGKDDKGFRTFELNIIPQPSQAFIKAYCEQGGIDEVDVEYEYHKVWDRQTEELLEKYLLLKVDSHNTITTHRIIEKKYSIDDIEAYCDKYPNDTELGREIRKLRYKQ